MRGNLTMNNTKIIAILTIISILIVENHGGLLDNVFGTIKNTTHEVSSGVGSLLSFGKGLVTDEKHPTRNEVVEHKKGIVGGFIDSIHGTIHNVHEKIRCVFLCEDKSTNKGVIENVLDRMKSRLAKVIELLSMEREHRKEVIKNTGDNAYHKINTCLFGNGTHNHGTKFRKVMNDLKDKIKAALHQNSTENPTPIKGIDDGNTDGTGLIDIRIADGVVRDLDEDMTRTKSGYNQARDDINKNVGRNRNSVQNAVQDIEKDVESGKKKIEESAVVFRDD